jgi:hypothetical protein
MRKTTLAALLVVAAHPPGLAAQSPWVEPISAPWPLADLAFQAAADGSITLLAYPNPITAQSDTAETYLTLALAPVTVRAWLTRARFFVDSVLKGPPRDIHDPVAGISLPTDAGAGRITLAHQPNTRPTSRFMLLIAPPPPAHSWSVQGGEQAARRLLAALDQALSLPSAVTLTTDSVRSECDSVGQPAIHRRPRMNLPTQKRLGGRIVLQFVVDTMGHPDTTTVRVLLSSGPEYTKEVRRELPALVYTPALCNGHPVRLLVQQGFAWEMRLRR